MLVALIAIVCIAAIAFVGTSASTKFSGVGRDGGVFGLHAYSDLQSVVWPG